MFNKKNILIAVVSFLLITIFGVLIYWFLFRKSEEEITSNNVDVPSAFNLIDDAYENDEITVDEMVKQKFYAVFDEGNFDSKYTSTEPVLHPDLDILLEENADKISKETAEEVLQYFKPPELEQDLILELTSDDYKIIDGELPEDEEKSSFFPEAKAASVFEQIKLNGVISGNHFNLFFQKSGDQSVSVSEVSQMARDLDYSMNQYISWGYKKPRIESNIGGLWNPLNSDITELLSGKIPVYVIKSSGDNTLGLAVSNPGWFKDIAISIGIFKDIDITAELLSNSIFPYINVYAGTINDYANRIGYDSRDVFKTVMYHEVFHMAQNGIGKNTEKFWSENTAQWATLQLIPDSKFLARKYLSRYFDNVNKSIDGQNGKTEYEVYPFAEIVSQKLGRDFIKKSLLEGEVFKNINDSYSGSFSGLLNDFASRNYLLDYDKGGITNVGRRPRIVDDISIQEVGKNYTLDNLALSPAAVNYIRVTVPDGISVSSLKATVESNVSFADQMYITTIGTAGSDSYEKIETKTVSGSQVFDLNVSEYKSFVFAVSNGSFVESGSLSYSLNVTSEEGAPSEVVIDDSAKRKPGSVDTVMVIDSSGSMLSDAKLTDTKSISKFEAAKSSANKITQLIEKESRLQDYDNKVGVVGFSGSAKIVSALSSDYDEIKSTISAGFGGAGGTNVGDGMQKGLDMLLESNAPNKVMIVLTDGQSNAGLSKNEIISGPATKARDNGVTVYTIGFDAQDVDDYYYEPVDSVLLYRIANLTGGKYYYAQKVTELASAFIDLYHSSTGNLVAKTKGSIKQDEVKKVKINVEPGSGNLRATLNWPGSKLEMKLIDPNGKSINLNSSRIELTEDKDFEDIIFRNPVPGEWQIEIKGVDVPEDELEFFLTASSQERESVLDMDYIVDWVQDRSAYVLLAFGLTNFVIASIVYLRYKKRRNSN